MQVVLPVGLMPCDTVNCVIILKRAFGMAWLVPQNTAKSNHDVVSTIKSDLLSWIVFVCCLTLQMKQSCIAVKQFTWRQLGLTYIHKPLLR